MNTATLTLPAPETAAPGADEDLGLPGWLYRSEAFAEDLLAGDEASTAPAPGWRLPAMMYPVTLALAVLATLPSALTLA